MTGSVQLLDQKPLSVKKRHGRAMNAIADFLRRRLSVPNIYLQPSLYASPKIDVMAADRAGSGDIHAVELKIPNNFVNSPSNLEAYIRQLKECQAHFKYLALPKNEGTLRLAQRQTLFASDGIGRVGVMLVTESDDIPPTVELLVSPERFRMEHAFAQDIDRFLAKKHPDMSVRI